MQPGHTWASCWRRVPLIKDYDNDNVERCSQPRQQDASVLIGESSCQRHYCAEATRYSISPAALLHEANWPIASVARKFVGIGVARTFLERARFKVFICIARQPRVSFQERRPKNNWHGQTNKATSTPSLLNSLTDPIQFSVQFS